MPIYEYICQSCGARHETLQKFSDPLLTKCPKCNGRLKKLISNTSFVLKGSGWYLTDYARKGPGSQPEAGKNSKNGKKKADTPEKKTETPATAGAKNEKDKNTAPAPKT